jgi:hypothetical protein
MLFFLQGLLQRQLEHCGCCHHPPFLRHHRHVGRKGEDAHRVVHCPVPVQYLYISAALPKTVQRQYQPTILEDNVG